VSYFVHQLRYEQLLFWRSREAAIFVFLLPVLLFVLLGAVYNGTVDGFPAEDYLVVGMLGYGVASTAFGGLAIFLVGRRELGILKRLRSTPLPPAAYLAAVLASTMIVFALQSTVLIALGYFAYGADLPDRPAALLLALALGAVCFAGLGVGAASIIRTAEGSSPIVNVVILPMAFLSGSFGPPQDYPAVLETIGRVLPLRYFIDLVRGAYLQNDAIWARPGAIAILLAWGAVGVAVAVRYFGWEPRSR
jgi:ABC-2 type transport system permease protein